jgi:LacI family transcriptional regulator
MATMREVARRAGVSLKTVSRVFNDDEHVEQETRQRVQQVLREVDYTPNTLARAFRAGKDAALGLAVPDIADPFFAPLARAVEDVAVERGMSVVVTSLGLDGRREQAAVEFLLHRRISGLITTPISGDQSYLAPWLPRTPVVFVDRTPSLEGADSFVEDDRGGARAATEHLLAHGHRRIAFLGDDLAVPTTSERLAGHREALHDAQVPDDGDLVRLGDWSVDRVTTELRRLLEQGLPEGRPSALFCSNVRSTISVVLALQALRRTDVALVSFGDFPLAAALCPALTVVDQDPSQLGRLAAERLFDRLDHPGPPRGRTTVLPVRLVARGSGELPPRSRG